MNFLDIPRRNASCAACQSAFAPGSLYYSFLRESGKGPVQLREDYCLPCAEKILSEPPSDSVQCLWKSKVPDKKVARKESLDRDTRALDLIRTCQDPEKGLNEVNEAEAFLLAVYLSRKRVLHLKKEMEHSGHPYYLYEISETEEMLPIKKIDLSALSLETLQERLAKKLSGSP